jgi:hypothetical protein
MMIKMESFGLIIREQMMIKMESFGLIMSELSKPE